MELVEFYKIIGIGLLTLICYVVVKPIKPDIAIFISLAGGLIILILCIESLVNIISAITNIFEKTGLNNSLFKSILKIIGVGYLTEFAAGLCDDSGSSTLADKILFAGKLCILILSLPIITNLLNIIVEILK